VAFNPGVMENNENQKATSQRSFVLSQSECHHIDGNQERVERKRRKEKKEERRYTSSNTHAQ
jgi:hypothetical protein